MDSALERCVEVGPQVFDVFDAHAQAQQRRGQVLLPRDARAPLHRGLHRAEARGVMDDLQAGAHLSLIHISSLDTPRGTLTLVDPPAGTTAAFFAHISAP